MTSVTLSTYDEVLKTFYLPGIQEMLNHGTVLSDLIEVNEKDVSGKNATIECHYGRSTGTGSRKDGGALPTADYQKYKTATVPMRYHYGRIELTGPSIAATRDDRGAYIRALDSEVTGIVRDLQKEVNRMLWGNGYGVLGRWRSTESGTSYTLQKAYRGNSAGGDGFGSTFGGKYLKENSAAVPVVLTAYSSGFPGFTVDATNIAVSAITDTVSTYDTITCTDPSVTEAAGTFYVRPASLTDISASSAADYARHEMMGLRGIVTDTDVCDAILYDGSASHTVGRKTTKDSLQGLAVGSYAWWKAQVDKHSSGRYAGQRALTLNLMQKMFDKIEIAAGKDVGPNLIIMSHAMRREYLDLVQGDRRFVNTMELDGGWKALDYNGIPLLVDDDAIDGEIYFLTTSSLAIYRMSDYAWMEKDGAVLSRISGYDKYEAVLFRYAELGCTRRNLNGVICDLDYET